MRLLLIEDDPGIVHFLQPQLIAAGYAVDVALDGERGTFLARTNSYDIAIIDQRLPKKNGRQICTEIREHKKNFPILILSIVCEPIIKAELLNIGADDYLTKPFVISELLARLRALLRRPTRIESDVLSVGDITLYIKEHVVKKKNKEIILTKKEFTLLQYMMKNQGIALSRSMIMDHVWDMNADPFSNTIESHIVSLRKKVDPQARQIRTISGVGYKII